MPVTLPLQVCNPAPAEYYPDTREISYQISTKDIQGFVGQISAPVNFTNPGSFDIEVRPRSQRDDYEG